MKINSVNSYMTPISFKGYTKKSNTKGNMEHMFYYPHDSKRYSVQLEIVPLKNQEGSWGIPPRAKKGYLRVDLPQNGIAIDDSEIAGSEAVGYRYLIKDKTTGELDYAYDSGIISNIHSPNSIDKFNVLIYGRNAINRNGLSKQVFPDIAFPGYNLNPEMVKFNKNNDRYGYDEKARNRAINAVRNHGNKLGGNFAGIMRMLPIWAGEGYTKIIGTPFTKDDVSSHLYWTQNAYQIAPNLGSLEDFKMLQIELLKNGINWISDGAFVNEGLQGVHLKSVLKHGKESPFYYWFVANGLESDSLSLGVFPKNAEQYSRVRLVNAPYNLKQEGNNIKFKKNEIYDPSKTSYLQLYDSRLVSDDDLAKTSKLITTYSKTNTENSYEITSHDDVTQITTLEINPDEFAQNVGKTVSSWRAMGSGDKISLENPDFLKDILAFKYYKLATKDKGGVDLWDGNMDIAKLNFYVGNLNQTYIDSLPEDERAIAKEKVERAVYQAQDYAFQAGRYWTKLAGDTQFLYLAELFSDTIPTISAFRQKINRAVAKGALPKIVKEEMTDDVLRNVLSGLYAQNRLNRNSNSPKERHHFILNEMMNYPLDAIEFSPDLSAVLSSPYISKRANSKEQLDMSRYEYTMKISMEEESIPPEYEKLYSLMDDIYKEQMYRTVSFILRMISNSLHTKHAFFDKQDNLTEYGKYVIPVIMPEIMRYILVKAVKPDAKIKLSDEKIDYSEADLSNISLKTLKISGNPEQEAEAVIVRIAKNLTPKILTDEECIKLSDVFKRRLEKVDSLGLKMADAVLDRTELGLGWRIDAAKDIANIDALRGGVDNPEDLFDKVGGFWAKFNAQVKKENPYAYTTAEITDLEKFLSGKNGKYFGEIDAETKFLASTGINNTANYSYFYAGIRDLFAQNPENGSYDENADISKLKFKLDNIDGTEWFASNGFLYQYPIDSIIHSYTFLGNHDKPRLLHAMALDMALFNTSDLRAYSEKVSAVLNNPSCIDYSNVSPKAIAMGDRLLSAFDKVGTPEKAQASIKKAIADLASGKFKGENFNADVFGTRPFDVAINDVITQATLEYGFSLNETETKKLKDAVLKDILVPSMEKYKTIYKMLVTLPGTPTDFIGDKEGSTGYESVSNNNYQQNRNVVHYEWINDILKDKNILSDKKEYISAFYKEMNNIGALRSRQELSALTNGTPVVLGLVNTASSGPVLGTFRYNEKGSQVICLYTNAGARRDSDEIMQHPEVTLPEFPLSGGSLKGACSAGLQEGDEFVDANPEGDKIRKYKVVFDNEKKIYKLVSTNDDNRGIVIKPSDLNTLVLYKENPVEYKPDKVDFNYPPIELYGGGKYASPASIKFDTIV